MGLADDNNRTPIRSATDIRTNSEALEAPIGPIDDQRIDVLRHRNRLAWSLLTAR
ncbi:MAG: hypothetical protein M3Y49_13845 [Actinomycetota bacterium]|nr:hypothetical protein [Actinomycetota bacterium]